MPVDDLILDKLIWPLRSAKQAFCLGNYLGCIALAGMVAEMVVVFLFDLSKPSFSGVPLSEDAQKALFGSTFEKLGQERRISILKTLGILSDDLQIAAERIKTIRRAYLHILSKDSAKIETEAEECYKFATSLVREVVALNPADGGTISIPNRLANYLGRPHEGTK